MLIYRLSKVITIALCIILFVNIILFLNAHMAPYISQGKSTEGEPFYFVDLPKYWCAISDFAECDGYLYVLFESKGVLSCYDLDGEYLHSFALSMGKNGQAHLYVDHNTLYLESKEHHFYTFSDGKFVDSFVPDISQIHILRNHLNDSTDRHQAEGGNQYELRGASLWKVGKYTSEEVLHRASWLVVFQGDIQIAIHIVCIVLLILLIVLRGKGQCFYP